MTFDKTVYASYLNTSGVVLISSRNISTGVQFRISKPDFISTKNSDIMEIVLNDDQMDLLRDDPRILKNSSNSYIILEPGIIRDTTVNLNPYLDVSANETHPMRVNDLADDVTPPTISYFDLDLTSRILSIRMSKIIKIDSIQLNSLSLQSDKSATGLTEKVIFSISNSELRNKTKNTNLIQIEMGQSYQLLRGFRFLGKSAASTFLAATTTFLVDTSPAGQHFFLLVRF